MDITSVQNRNAERLAAACVLSVVGGFLDMYTYLCRGKVFANAVTGNMVLFGLNLASLEWTASIKYFLPIFFYALGVFAAEYIHRELTPSRRLGWHQTVLILEILFLLPIVFIPYGDFDFAVSSIIAFICALQVQTFRRVHGLPFASTMCTGNLRSGTEALAHRIFGRDHAGWSKARHYYLVIVWFIVGAVLGAILFRMFGHLIFFLAPAALIVVFFMVTTGRQAVFLRKIRRTLLQRK